MTEDDKALVDRLRYDCHLATQLGDDARIVLPATFARTIISRIEAQAAEIERLRQSQTDALKKARGAINGLLDIASEENLDSEQAGRAYAALHEIGTALAALEAHGLEIRERG
jgi:hypothetical protein